MATGSGNAALAAARCGCQVTGVDYVPGLLERGRERAAAELVRVCRPGGTIALANWTPTGFIGQLLRTVGRHVPPPAGVRPPTLWGTEERLGELLGAAVSTLEVRRRTFTFRFGSAEDFTRYFRDNYGPVHKAFAALDGPGQERFAADLTALAAEHDRAPGLTAAIDSEYLEVVATRS